MQGNGITILPELPCLLRNHRDLTNNSFKRLPNPSMHLQGLLLCPIFFPFPFPKPILEFKPLISLIKLLTNLPDSEIFHINTFYRMLLCDFSQITTLIVSLFCSKPLAIFLLPHLSNASFSACMYSFTHGSSNPFSDHSLLCTQWFIQMK